MKLVLAEKPSVAMSLSKVIGADQRGDGYMEGNGSLEPQRFTSFSPTRESCSAFIIPPPVYSIAKSVYDTYH